MKKKPLLIGLTGSIGMGKSATARLFKQLGAPVFCADKAAREALAPGGKAFKRVAALFPAALACGGLNRRTLGKMVFADPALRRKLENIVHPIVFAEREKFTRRAAREGAKAVLLDIPLLFETGADKKVDRIVCVTAPRKMQEKRVLARKNMTKAKFLAILAAQTPDAEKRRRADYIVRTDKGFAAARKQVRHIWEEITETKNARNRS